MSRGIALAAAFAGLALTPGSAAASGSSDPWFGRDKALHFTATFVLATGGYAGCALLSRQAAVRLACGGALAMGAGVGKELLDLMGYGDPSWRDLTWDAIGTATGLLAAWAVDHFVFGKEEPSPQAAAGLGAEPDGLRPGAASGVAVQVRDAIALMRELRGTRALPLFTAPPGER